jgi:CheY-like chemotaxis protein
MPATILIVEDEVILAMDIDLALRDLGYEVAGIAFSGHDAVMQAAHKRPDLVLVDIKLKGYMDGIDAARLIQKRYHIPVIYITGNTDEKTMARALKTQPAGYLRKPVSDSMLRKAIENALETDGGRGE